MVVPRPYASEEGGKRSSRRCPRLVGTGFCDGFLPRCNFPLAFISARNSSSGISGQASEYDRARGAPCPSRPSRTLQGKRAPDHQQARSSSAIWQCEAGPPVPWRGVAPSVATCAQAKGSVRAGRGSFRGAAPSGASWRRSRPSIAIRKSKFASFYPSAPASGLSASAGAMRRKAVSGTCLRSLEGPQGAFGCDGAARLKTNWGGEHETM